MKTIPDSKYVELYNMVKESGLHTIQTDIDDCILIVNIVVRILNNETVGATDDYGNQEYLNLSSYDVTVKDHYMIDENCDIEACDFDPEAFESMFE